MKNPIVRSALGIAACSAVGILQLFVMAWLASAQVSSWVVGACVLLPGVILMVFVVGAARRWYWWCALWFLLFFGAAPEAMPLILVAGTTWIVYATLAPTKPHLVRHWAWVRSRLPW